VDIKNLFEVKISAYIKEGDVFTGWQTTDYLEG
jgi:hypothetical protein